MFSPLISSGTHRRSQSAVQFDVAETDGGKGKARRGRSKKGLKEEGKHGLALNMIKYDID